jgi:hypothetical protein
MTDQIEPTEEPTAPAPLGEPIEETVGDIMKKSSGEGIKFWVIVLSILVYITGIVYAEVHALNMLSQGVAADMRIWATAGMVAAGLSAIGLPLALKVWTIDSKQRIAAYIFYLLDFAFLCFNAFVDFDRNTGQQLAPWALTYATYILPASPIIIAALWALVWELDPSVREKVLALSLRVAMKEKVARQVAQAAKGQNVNAVVSAAAQREVDRALTELFGAPVTGYTMNAADLPTTASRGLMSSFFGMLSSQLRRAISTLTPSQSERPDSQK